MTQREGSPGGTAVMRPLDFISIGRSSVDLYGGQVGGRLEDMRTFDKYIGGSPTNTAAGAARLGMKSAVITRVGDEHMGRFIREQLQAEGVDVRGVVTDPERLTALVLLGIRDQEQFPLIFYRENCADMGLTPEDIDPDFIAEARCVLASGTHVSHPRTEAATLKAVDLARANGAKTILDVDYRPNLWGLAGHGAGESRFIESGAVTAKLQGILDRFDVIVGTEEEFHIAGGATDTREALAGVRGVDGGDPDLQAGRRRRHRVRGADPAEPRRRRQRRVLPGRGVQRAGRRRRLHGRPAQGLARRRRLGRDAPHRQCLWRARRLASRLHAVLPQRR